MVTGYGLFQSSTASGKNKREKKNEIHILGMCTDAYTMMILYKGESFES